MLFQQSDNSSMAEPTFQEARLHASTVSCQIVGHLVFLLCLQQELKKPYYSTASDKQIPCATDSGVSFEKVIK